MPEIVLVYNAHLTQYHMIPGLGFVVPPPASDIQGVGDHPQSDLVIIIPHQLPEPSSVVIIPQPPGQSSLYIPPLLGIITLDCPVSLMISAFFDEFPVLKFQSVLMIN